MLDRAVRAGARRGREDRLPPVPDQLPTLGRGRHPGGGKTGACVMEYVSVLAGQRFTDHPRCTHPALAGLARQVNDRIRDDAVRARLASLAPALIGTRGGDPRVTLTIALACLRAAARAGAADPEEIRRQLTLVQSRLTRLSPEPGRPENRLSVALARPWRSLRASMQLNAAVELGYAGMRARPTAERDRWLYALLAEAIRDTRRVLDLPPPTGSSAPPVPSAVVISRP